MMTDMFSRPRRLVLSSVSDYFAAMFTSDVREAKQDEVKMEGVDPDALWVLVQYAYTGKKKRTFLKRTCSFLTEGSLLCPSLGGLGHIMTRPHLPQ